MKKYLISGLMIVSISVFGILLDVNITQKAFAQGAVGTVSWDQPSYTADQSLNASGTVVGSYSVGECSVWVDMTPTPGTTFCIDDGDGGCKAQSISEEEIYISGFDFGDFGGMYVTDPEDNFSGYIATNLPTPVYGPISLCPEQYGISTDFGIPVATFTYSADTSNDWNNDSNTLTVSDDVSSSSASLNIVHQNNPTNPTTPTTNPSTYTVSTGGSGCTASPETQTVNSGDNASVSFTPDSNYTINSNDLSDTCGGGSFSNGTYTTGAISSDCEVDAVCEPQIIGIAPTVTLTANPYSIQTGENSTLRWSSTKADSCSADWTSNTMTNGSETVSPTATKTYTITCTNNASGQTGSASATVTVTNTPPPPPPPPVNGGWGGWGPWSSCSASCGGGTQEESRACDSPTPAYGGSQCTRTDDSLGLSETQTQACNTQPCTPTTNGVCSTTQHYICSVGSYDSDGVNNTSNWTWSCTGSDNVPVSCTMQKPKPVYKEN
jgi:hypothetical protein